MTSVMDEIRANLAILEPESLELDDESFLHQGHEGAKSGGGHFNLIIVSRHFKEKSPILRHRMVFEALHGLMQKEIHALSIKAYTPDEI